MVQIRWTPEHDYFLLYGSAIFPVSFENVENEYEASGKRVGDVLSDLWNHESWVRDADSAILETKFELWPIKDEAGIFRLALRRLDKGDDFADYWGFGWVNLDKSTSPHGETGSQEYIKNLANFVWSVESPVVCDATVHLTFRASTRTCKLDGIIVTLPAPKMWEKPIFPEPYGYSLDSTRTSVLYDEKAGNIALRATEMTHVPMALFESERAMKFVHNNYTEREIFVDLALIPEPENDHDPQAIAVVLSMNTTNIRIGYLCQHYRGPLLGGLLNDLVQYSPRGIKCLGIIDQGPTTSQSIRLMLPERVLLEHDIREFLRKTPLSQQALRESNPVVSRVDQFRAEALRLIADFRHAPSHGAVRFRTREMGGDRVRMVSVQDCESGREIGVISQGFLSLKDERRRDAIVVQAMEEGIEFSYGAEEFHSAVSPDFRITDDFVPNISARMYDNYVAFDTGEKSRTGERLLLAEYNWRTEEMWVQDEAVVPSVCRFAARVGLNVSYLDVPPTAWWLKEQIHYTRRRDYTRRGATHLGSRNVEPPLSDKTTGTETLNEFKVREKLQEERKILFPQLEYTGDVGSCRVCGTKTLTFSVPFFQHSLAYCHLCVVAAHRGRRQTAKDEVLRIATALFRVENFGNPMPAVQLRSVNILSRRDISEYEIDSMVRLRQKFRYQDWPWNDLLIQSGLLEATRTSRGTRIYAVDGHVCYSLYEKLVDDFLHIHDISHEIEPNYPYDVELNPHSAKRADWRLGDGTLVEMWGLEGDLQYERKRQEKVALAGRHGLHILSIKPNDLVRLSNVFAEWMPTAG